MGRVEDSRMVKSSSVSLSSLQVIALAEAVEENQANLLQSFARLKSATHLVILLVGLWQKLSPDQVALLEAAFLPLQENAQELSINSKVKLLSISRW
ncbi:protein PTHB1-like [Fukomys damarensis]|uniref:protein PTHB1-like n=1 Tax=Fukomys damarensis TaxID=885580 RepID=UPI0014557864|nr:protein PTHB1-like [Fukomys damarensis]